MGVCVTFEGEKVGAETMHKSSFLWCVYVCVCSVSVKMCDYYVYVSHTSLTVKGALGDILAMREQRVSRSFLSCLESV